MSWEIVAGVITLSGFLITVGTLAAKLAGVLSRLETSVRELTETIAEVRRENLGEHRAMQQRLEGHENRITVLEVKRREGY